MHWTENSKQIFPEMKLRGLSPNSYAHVSGERFIYFHDRSAYSAAGKYVGLSWEYINLAIPFLGIHKWDFRCSVGSLKPKSSHLLANSA